MSSWSFHYNHKSNLARIFWAYTPPRGRKAPLVPKVEYMSYGRHVIITAKYYSNSVDFQLKRKLLTANVLIQGRFYITNQQSLLYFTVMYIWSPSYRNLLLDI